ncbi:MAG: [acyl-carrier-protein] S-malonyltransferase [Anaerolineaceae bacterium]|nr:MAG: [acyl-carrier-protein] S-malonyltransferase [Anaerolineaceae bacterium]
MDWSQTAFIFPGQGSQKVGMGADFYATSPAAKAIFDEADDVLETGFSALIFEGPAAELDDTYNTQAALYVCGVAGLAALQEAIPTARAICLAGHSLGEFTALTASGALSFADGLRLVRERGRLMREAGQRNAGAMAALLGASLDVAHEICTAATLQTSAPVVIANDNCPGQVVISGAIPAVDRAIALAAQKGVSRAVKLAVSVAAHSPLMASSADAFRETLAQTPINPPQIPVYGNVSAAPLADVDAIRAELDRQLTEPVRWTPSVQAMIRDGAVNFVEIGAGNVLAGLVKRIERKAGRYVVEDMAGVSALAG